jgi:hypothetical protein
MSGGNREHGEHGNGSVEHVDLVAIARAVCTDSQLEVIHLRETGLGWKAIALILGVGPDAVRDRHRRAVANVMKEVDRVETLRRSSAGPA